MKENKNINLKTIFIIIVIIAIIIIGSFLHVNKKAQEKDIVSNTYNDEINKNIDTPEADENPQAILEYKNESTEINEQNNGTKDITNETKKDLTE